MFADELSLDANGLIAVGDGQLQPIGPRTRDLGPPDICAGRQSIGERAPPATLCHAEYGSSALSITVPWRGTASANVPFSSAVASRLRYFL